MSKKKAQSQDTAAAVEEDKPLTVDDIPGAVAPSEADEAGTSAADDSGGSSLHNRLSAFRERRTGGEGSGAIAGARRSGTGPRAGGRGRPGGGPAGAGRPGGAAAAGGGGRAALQARRNAAAGGGNDDAAAKGKEILKQVISRMNTQGGDKPLHKALKGVARGYQALENEVARLREELDSYKS